MTLGRYVNNNSFVHRLDPRNKFLLLFVFMVVIFLINPTRPGFEIFGWACYLLMIIFFFILYKIAHLKFHMVFSSLKSMWFMMIFLLIANLFIYKTGAQLVNWWIFDIHVDALTQTGKIVVRLALLIILSTLFTATTKPLDITIAVDDLFAWLKIFHIPVHILSMMISITLRFIPTILEETQKIMKAQASRGVDFKNGKFKEKVVAITSLIVPLFISAIARSDELANAMEARHYDPLAKRTRFRTLKWRFVDTFSLILSNLLMIAGIVFVILVNKEIIVYWFSNNFFFDIFNISHTFKGIWL